MRKNSRVLIPQPSPKRFHSSSITKQPGTTRQRRSFKFPSSDYSAKSSVKAPLRTTLKPRTRKKKSQAIPDLPLAKVNPSENPSGNPSGNPSKPIQLSTSRVRTKRRSRRHSSRAKLNKTQENPVQNLHSNTTTTEFLLDKNSHTQERRHIKAKLDSVQFPLSAAQALQLFIHELTGYELGEILNYREIHFLGLSARKPMTTAVSERNFGHDDERGDYKVVRGDHIAYRYEVLEALGSGSFGQVLKVFDHKHNATRALKVIRNKPRFHKQAAIEIKVLKFLKGKDLQDTHNIVHIEAYFSFRRHVCIVFELCSISLFDLLKKNHFQGFSLSLVKRFAWQILQSLVLQEQFEVIHCDLKPENILLRSFNKSGIKVIDYGSSCFGHERVYTYIQSRFYRAPEVMLGTEYSTKIDMWSFGCILAELYTGTPLFPGESENEQMCCIMELLGVPTQTILRKATREKTFFGEDNTLLYTNGHTRKRTPGTKRLEDVLRGTDASFRDLVGACLQWDPESRITAQAAVQHEWFVPTSRVGRNKLAIDGGSGVQRTPC